MNRRTLGSLTCLPLALVLLFVSAVQGAQSVRRAGDSVPDDFPRFVVPGHEREMSLLRELYWLHDQPAGPLIPLWDEWMPMSTLWPARGEGLQLNSMRGRWAAALAGRAMNAEGFVHTHQHDGPAHAEGWPFPLWQQAGGIGWHFAPTGVPGYDAPHATPDGWTLTAARGQALSAKGWPIELTAAGATAQTPSFAVEARAAPWLRLNWWASGLERANPYVEWTAKDAPQFSPDRRLYFSAAGGDGPVDLARGETRSMLPMYRLPAWKGAITGLRIGFDNPGPAQVVIKSFHTACDTRQNINNSNFIRGCHDYFLWTSDLTFLRGQIGRIRTAMRFMMREFDTRARKCVYTTWPGHEGRSGVRRVAGKTVIVTGEGIGSNYFWGWSNPESVPWGNQVQDGGAVLGFSYHDLMARLKTAGPDDAWQRLRDPGLVRRGPVGRRLSPVLQGPVAGHDARRQRARWTRARQGVLRVDPRAASHVVRVSRAAADSRRFQRCPAAARRLERAIDHADSLARPRYRRARYGRDHRGDRLHPRRPAVEDHAPAREEAGGRSAWPALIAPSRKATSNLATLMPTLAVGSTFLAAS